MELQSDDIQRVDINFENILYTVSVPKQKGEWNGLLIDNLHLFSPY